MIGVAVASIAVAVTAIDECAGGNTLAKVASAMDETPERHLSTPEDAQAASRLTGQRSHSIPGSGILESQRWSVPGYRAPSQQTVRLWIGSHTPNASALPGHVWTLMIQGMC